MKIKLKLYATLTDYLPAEALNHATEVEIPTSATASQILDNFKVPRQMVHLVLLNGVYLEPTQRDTPTFKDGDTLAVWPPVAGG